ncbi:MAG: hypothetical protein ACRCUP_03065 [Mycoplasmatales bacterium]
MNDFKKMNDSFMELTKKWKILITICTCGLAFNLWVFNKIYRKFKAKGVSKAFNIIMSGVGAFLSTYLVILTFLIIALAFSIIETVLTPSGEIMKTYDVLTSEVNYEIAGIPAKPAKPAKPAVYKDPKTATINNEGILVCGKDIPIGLYTVDINGQNPASYRKGGSYIVKWQKVGKGKFDGAMISDAEDVPCVEGYQVRAFNDSGTVILEGEPELIKDAVPAVPAVPAIPAKQIKEIYEFNKIDSDESCQKFIDDQKETDDCGELTKKDELMKNAKVKFTVEETLRIFGESETCYRKSGDDEQETVECSSLKRYDELKKEIIVE